MRRVLIVSPHFPPVNAPDMQRARHLLPHLRGLGWEPVVLAVDPSCVEGAVLDPVLEQTYPADARVVRVRGIRPAVTRRLGFGSLWLRCGAALRRAGDALLAAERFDLVFFTTTQFDAFTLGPRWRRRFGVPYVLDYQDPWINPYYRDTGTRPPGGWAKFRLSQWTARMHQGRVLRGAAGVIAVSSAYGPMLQRQHAWFDAARVVTLPFAVSPDDFAVAARHRPARPLVPFGDGRVHHVYAGRCGPDMSASLITLFRAFRKFHADHPVEAGRHRFHFIGTDYAPPPLGREWVMPTARREGVDAFVTEHNYRVPYFDALHYLMHADALLIVGSNDATYSASKTYPCLMSRRPVLVIAHEASPMLQPVRAEGVSSCYTFGDDGANAGLIAAVAEDWFYSGGWSRPYAPTGRLLAAHGAGAMSGRLAEVFQQAAAA